MKHSRSLTGANRAARIGDQIQKDLAQIVQQLKDERLKGILITLTGVDMAPDHSLAKVHYSFFGDAPAATVQAVLEHAKPMLRRELGRGLMLRLTPELSFHFDESITRGAQMSALIDHALLTQAKD